MKRKIDSPRKKRSKKLPGATEEQLRIFIDQCPLAIAMFDKNMIYLAASQKWIKDLVHGNPNCIGRHHYEVFPDLPVRWLEIHRRCLAGATEKSEADAFPRLDGTMSYQHWEVRPWRDRQGKIGGIIILSEDITERKQAEDESNKYREQLLFRERLSRSKAEKNVLLRDDFISIAAHELRTPLTALKIQFQLIPQLLRSIEFQNKEKILSLFQNSVRQLELFSNLMDELLDVSRISSGTFILQPKNVNLTEAVTQILEQYQTELKNAGCVVSTQLERDVQGYWDPIRMGQVVVNLLTNAMKYGAGKPILIKIYRKSNNAILVVQDHGIGIQKKDQERIFNRFERVAPVSGYRGLGLGLYVTRQIIQAHGGTVEVKSEPERGASFIVALPLRMRLNYLAGF